MRLGRTRIALLLLAGLFAAPRGAAAVQVTLSTPDATPAIGVPFLVTVGVSGLGDMMSPSLRAFTLRLDFDEPLLDVNDVVFGTQLGFPCALGDPNPACEAQVFDMLSPGSLLFAENSLLTVSGLASQPGSFTLATIELVGDLLGLTSLSLPDDLFTDLVLTDLGDPEDITTVSFSVTPLQLEVVVPEPGTAALLLFGLGVVGGLRRRRS